LARGTYRVERRVAGESRSRLTVRLAAPLALSRALSRSVLGTGYISGGAPRGRRISQSSNCEIARPLAFVEGSDPPGADCLRSAFLTARRQTVWLRSLRRGGPPRRTGDAGWWAGCRRPVLGTGYISPGVPRGWGISQSFNCEIARPLAFVEGRDPPGADYLPSAFLTARRQTVWLRSLRRGASPRRTGDAGWWAGCRRPAFGMWCRSAWARCCL